MDESKGIGKAIRLTRWVIELPYWVGFFVWHGVIKGERWD